MAANWKLNPIWEWSFDGGTTWQLVTDHGRSSVNMSVERVENKQRMADGTLRRYVVTKKRTWQTSWENLPSVATPSLANGQPGSWIENIHDTVDGSFHVRFRAGSDINTTLSGLAGTVVKVMITDYSRETVKRNPNFDLWNIDITLEEV